MSSRTLPLVDEGPFDLAQEERHIVGEINKLALYWVPRPGQTFADCLRDVPRLEFLLSELAQAKAEAFARHAPDWMSDEERLCAQDVIMGLFYRDPSATSEELLLTLAAAVCIIPPHGRAPVWAADDGRLLVALVDAGLAASGKTRQCPKAVRRVIGEIRDRLPMRYDRWSEERLRKAYYEALSAQSGKSPN